MAWSEESLHDWLRRRSVPPDLVGGRGNDAAVLGSESGRPVLCADQTIEGVHFEAGTPAARVGHKAAARALSDLAATGARPRALLATLAAARETPERELRALLAAVDRSGRRYGAPLVGGDLACRPGPLALSISAYGVLAGRRPPPSRSAIEAGDVLLLTGPVGGSRARRHLAFEPRLEAGQLLFAAGARAMMDVSDGLALDLSRLAAASGVRLVLEHVPIHRDAVRAAGGQSRRALEHALSDGEDHELIAAVPASGARRAERELQRALPNLTRIGHAERGRGLLLALPGERPARWNGEGGWHHGG